MEMTPEQLRRFIRDIMAARPGESQVEQKIVGTMELRFVSGADDRPVLYSTIFRPGN